jgi:hypothetical protein
MAWMLLTMALASGEGDHGFADTDAAGLVRASINVTLTFGFPGGMRDRCEIATLCVFMSYY